MSNVPNGWFIQETASGEIVVRAPEDGAGGVTLPNSEEGSLPVRLLRSLCQDLLTRDEGRERVTVTQRAGGEPIRSALQAEARTREQAPGEERQAFEDFVLEWTEDHVKLLAAGQAAGVGKDPFGWACWQRGVERGSMRAVSVQTRTVVSGTGEALLYQPLSAAEIQAIADDGHRNAAGGIYESSVLVFAHAVVQAFAQKNGLKALAAAEERGQREGTVGGSP